MLYEKGTIDWAWIKMRLIHLLILIHCNMIGRVQLASQLEGSPPPIDWLLRELNGAHLRLSIAVVCIHAYNVKEEVF